MIRGGLNAGVYNQGWVKKACPGRQASGFNDEG